MRVWFFRSCVPRPSLVICSSVLGSPHVAPTKMSRRRSLELVISDLCLMNSSPCWLPQDLGCVSLLSPHHLPSFLEGSGGQKGRFRFRYRDSAGSKAPGMAGSRLETVGSIFTRTRDLIRAGVLKEKPLWFDIYNAFPPLREPVFRRPRLRYGKAKSPTQDIFYHEDQIRAKFYSAYGSGPKAFELFNPNFKSTCQRFVEKYIELQKLGETDEEKLFVEAGKALLAEGVILRRVEKARTQQEGSQVSQKSESMGVESQTALEENPPLNEVPQAQHLEAPGEELKGLSPP
uniref:Small ribosomal subunit protein mS23 n=1 Tax=Capra hircus TaxID=9925 RepID=A0A8C2R5I3_CAPHI